ncbi:unnamed protein product [Caretta caretta]
MDGFMFVLLERGSITCVISISFKVESCQKTLGMSKPFLEEQNSESKKPEPGFSCNLQLSTIVIQSQIPAFLSGE